MKRLPIAAILMVILALPACQTLGIPWVGGDDPNKDREQAALEGAAIAMVFAYAKMAGDEDMPHSEHLRATLKAGNDFIIVMYPEFGSWSALLEKRIADVTSDKFNPQVATMYYLLFEILEFTEKESAPELEPL